MQYILSSEQMRNLDQRTISEAKIPSMQLMENAGTACAESIKQLFPQHLSGQIIIACGNGNNGGDGYVIARLLYESGFAVNIMRIKETKQSPETSANMQLCLAIDIPFIQINSSDDLANIHDLLPRCSLIVDAIFGIGFRGEPEALYQEIFVLLNAADAFRVAIDIPSGLNADTGTATSAFVADHTFAIASYKSGQLIGKGGHLCGEITCIPIGIPAQYFTEIKAAKLINKGHHRYPLRNRTYNKSHYGRAFILAGSRGFTGAALLTAKSALRSGAGYVHLLYRPELTGIYEAVIPELLCSEIPSSIEKEMPDIPELAKILSKASSILIGPGFGMDDFARQILHFLLKDISVPLIVDADAITLIAQEKSLCSYLKKANILLTPHVGEFIRLADIDKTAFESDPMLCLKEFVDRHHAQVLLKNYNSIYQDTAQIYFSISGNDGLATGGSGDVLSGIITAFAAQGMDIASSAINASYLLGYTAEKLAERRYPASIIPSDIIENIFIKE